MALKNMQERQNVVSGLAQMLYHKMLFSPFVEMGTNRDYFGNSIRDENSPAYQQIYQWTLGAIPTAPCAYNGTVWTCSFTRSNGYQALAVWNPSETCTNGLCTTKEFTLPIGYVQYRNISGTLTPITGTQLPVGLKPVLLENKSAW